MSDCKALSSYNIQLSVSHTPICISAQCISMPRTVPIFPTSRSTGSVLRTPWEKPVPATKPRAGLGNGRGAPPAGPAESTHRTLGWQREQQQGRFTKKADRGSHAGDRAVLGLCPPSGAPGKEGSNAPRPFPKGMLRGVPKMQMIFQLEKSQRRVACSHMA